MTDKSARTCDLDLMYISVTTVYPFYLYLFSLDHDINPTIQVDVRNDPDLGLTARLSFLPAL